jgi:hypothetical protein
MREERGEREGGRGRGSEEERGVGWGLLLLVGIFGRVIFSA